MKVNVVKHPSKDGWYYVDYRPNGYKKERVRIPIEGYANACRRRQEVEAKYDTPDSGASKQTHPRLEAVANEYLAWAERNKAKETMQGKRRRLLHHIIPKLGHLRVKDLSQRALDDYGKDMAAGSYRDDVIHLLALIRWMVKRHYAEPLTWQPEVPPYRAPIKTIPAPEDILKFIAAIRAPDQQTLFSLMLYTGLRWNEATNLRWEDYQGNSLRLAKTKTKVQESIFIPEHLQPWFAENKKASGWIFPQKRTGKPYQNLQKMLLRVGQETGVKMTPHLFRHASATMLYELTRDLYAVKHHLRQSRITTTEIYTRYSIALSKQAVTDIAVHMDRIRKDGSSGNNEGK